MPSEVVLPSALTPVIEECAGLGRAFSEAGARLFLVGGIVRDAFEGRTLDDPKRMKHECDAFYIKRADEMAPYFRQCRADAHSSWSPLTATAMLV